MNTIERQVFEAAGKIKAETLAEVVDNLGEDKVLEIVNQYMHKKEFERIMNDLWEAWKEYHKED